MANTKKRRAAITKTVGGEGDDVRLVHKTDGFATFAPITNSSMNFYSPAEAFSKSIQEKIDHELRRAPLKIIDPATLNRPPEKLEGLALQRVIAIGKLKKYRSRHPVLSSLQTAIKRSGGFALTEKQCAMIISIAKQIEEKDLQNETV